MAEKIVLPEQEIVDTYKSNVWWTVSRLAKKYKTTDYQINKLLKTHNVLRQTHLLEKLIMERFLKYEVQHDGRRIPHEKNHAKVLIEKCPNEQFWNGLDLNFKLNSLAWFMSEAGTAFLRKKYSAFKFEIRDTETHNMSTEKIGEDVVTISKPKTLQEFLKG